MENRVNLMRKGAVLKLPPGFRFHPTDEELVFEYLARKIFSVPLPASIIPEVDVCKLDPWELPGDEEQPRYFFREAKYPNCSRSNRATRSGYWKAIGIDRKIMAPWKNRVAGMKKTLMLYQGKPSKGTKTDWIMHEYRLDSSQGEGLIGKSIATHVNLAALLEKWVLCRVFLKKRGRRNEERGQAVNLSLAVARANARTILCDLNEAPNTSSCDPSGVTDESSLEHEVLSSVNSLANVRNS